MLTEIAIAYSFIERYEKAIASQYAALGQQNKSKPEFKTALKIAKTIHYDESQVLALSAIATQYATLGQQEPGEILLAEALEITENLPDKAKTEIELGNFCQDWKRFYPPCWNNWQAEVKTSVIEFN